MYRSSLLVIWWFFRWTCIIIELLYLEPKLTACYFALSCVALLLRRGRKSLSSCIHNHQVRSSLRTELESIPIVTNSNDHCWYLFARFQFFIETYRSIHSVFAKLFSHRDLPSTETCHRIVSSVILPQGSFPLPLVDCWFFVVFCVISQSFFYEVVSSDPVPKEKRNQLEVVYRWAVQWTIAFIPL